MTKEEIEIEIKSYQEVIRQFTKGNPSDARMSISFDQFLKSIEDKIKELKSM